MDEIKGLEDEADNVEGGAHKEGKLEDEAGELENEQGESVDEINEINLEDLIDDLVDEPKQPR